MPKKKKTTPPAPVRIGLKLPCGCTRLGCGHVLPRPSSSSSKIASLLGEFAGGVLRELLRHSAEVTSIAAEATERAKCTELAIENVIHRELYDEHGRETPRHAELCRTSPRHAKHAEAVRAHRAGFRVGYEPGEIRTWEEWCKLKPRDPNAN